MINMPQYNILCCSLFYIKYSVQNDSGLSFKRISFMNKLIKIALLGAIIATVSGCTGSIYNKEKNCDYDYLFHPAISISKMIGGCGDTSK